MKSQADLFVFVEQDRLLVGPFMFVLRADGRWAIHGGTTATYADLVRFARRLAWPRPELRKARVRYRLDGGDPA